MKDRLIKWFMTINAALIRLSGGRIGGRLGAQDILILHTLGRKSGQERAIPIAYFEHAGGYLIVASNWGRDKEADWVLNLRREPRARLEVRGRSIEVKTREAQSAEYDRLWQFAAQRHPPYLRYQKMTARHIPIVLFEPL